LGASTVVFGVQLIVDIVPNTIMLLSTLAWLIVDANAAPHHPPRLGCQPMRAPST